MAPASITDDRRQRAAFLQPCPNEKERQSCVNGDGWPQQNSRPTGNPYVSEIQRYEHAVGQHPARTAGACRGPANTPRQRDKTEAGDPTDHDTSAGDVGIEQQPDQDGGIHNQNQASQSSKMAARVRSSFIATSGRLVTWVCYLGRFVIASPVSRTLPGERRVVTVVRSAEVVPCQSERVDMALEARHSARLLLAGCPVLVRWSGSFASGFNPITPSAPISTWSAAFDRPLDAAAIEPNRRRLRPKKRSDQA